jgi:hypothetical protein
VRRLRSWLWLFFWEYVLPFLLGWFVVSALAFACTANAAITHVADGTEGFPSFGTNPGAPAGLAANDILIMWFYSPDNVAHSVSNSFTKKVDYSPTSTDHITIWWKRTAGTTMGTTTCTGTSINDGSMCWVSAFRGVITTGDPFDVVAASATTGASATTLSIAAITTTSANDMLLVVGWASNVSNTISSVTGYTTAKEYGNGNGTTSDMIGVYKLLATAGSTGTATMNVTGATSTHMGGLIMSLIDASAGGGATPTENWYRGGSWGMRERPTLWRRDEEWGWA